MADLEAAPTDDAVLRAARYVLDRPHRFEGDPSDDELWTLITIGEPEFSRLAEGAKDLRVMREEAELLRAEFAASGRTIARVVGTKKLTRPIGSFWWPRRYLVAWQLLRLQNRERGNVRAVLAWTETSLPERREPVGELTIEIALATGEGYVMVLDQALEKLRAFETTYAETRSKIIRAVRRKLAARRL